MEVRYMSSTHTFVAKFAWQVLKMAEEIYKFKYNTLSGSLKSELYTHICIKICKLWAQNGGGKILVLRQYSKHMYVWDMSYILSFLSKFAWQVLKMAEEIYKFKDNT